MPSIATGQKGNMRGRAASACTLCGYGVLLAGVIKLRRVTTGASATTADGRLRSDAEPPPGTGVMAKHVHVLYAVVIVAMTIVFYVTGTAGVLLQASVMALLVPIYIQFLFRPRQSGTLARVLWVPLAYLAIAMACTIVNVENYTNEEFTTATVVIADIAFALFAAGLIAADASGDLPERVLEQCGHLMLGFLAFALLFIDRSSMEGRFETEDTHSNWWGMLGFGLVCCATFYRRKRFMFAASILVSIYLMYLAQARGAMLASLITLGLHLSIAMMKTTSRRQNQILFLLASFAVLATGVAVMLDYEQYAPMVMDFLYDDLLLLYDEERGIDTSLTGRLDGWIMAWNLWLDNPLFGTGLGTNADVHNGFLIVGSEGGLIYFTFVMYVLGLAARRAGARHPAFLATLAGYVTMMMTYPRSINLNFGALVFEIVLMASVARRPGRARTAPRTAAGPQSA